MQVYVVWREGVYMQGIFSVCDSLESAILVAEDEFSKEEDNYHDFNVSKFNINRDYSNDIYENYRNDIVYSVKKN